LEANSSGEQLTLRALVGTKEAGIIIGKQGANIKSIRESSNARVVVSEHMQGVPERIVSVTGAVDEVAKAYAQVARNLNQGDLRGNSADAVESTPLTVRFLLPHSRMGAVIGKGGARIKEIQEESNARLAATATPLPHSQDRILEMIGVPDAIHIATYHMLITIKEQADRPCHDRQYRPEYALAGHNHPHGGSGGMGGQHMHPSHMSGGMIGSGGQHGHGYGGGSGGYGYNSGGGYGGMGGGMVHPGPGGMNHGGPMETRTFYCPPDKVGPMIGKGGNRINRVRMETGCKINVEDARDSRGDRPFVITGSGRDVELAMRTLEAHLRREFARDQERGMPGAGYFGDQSFTIASAI
jgi:poly(rC)-binding protein 2/3/4